MLCLCGHMLVNNDIDSGSKGRKVHKNSSLKTLNSIQRNSWLLNHRFVPFFIIFFFNSNNFFQLIIGDF